MSRGMWRAREKRVGDTTLPDGLKFIAFAVASILVILSLKATIQPDSAGESRINAIFTSASRLKPGDQVRVAGVVSGSIAEVEVTEDGRARITMAVDSDLDLTTGTRATIKYLDLVGTRYLALTPGDGSPLRDGATLGVSQTTPALDLDTLFDGFKPLFAALSPTDVNALAADIIQVFQGEGQTVNHLLSRTASLTQDLANRDEVIGRVIENLNVVLGGLATRQTELNDLIRALRRFTSGLARDRIAITESIVQIDSLTATTAGLIREIRPDFAANIALIREFAQTLNKPMNRKQLVHTLEHVPVKLRKLMRTASYGSYFNYYLCDLRIRISDTEQGLAGLLRDKVLTYSAHDSAKRCNP